MRMNITSKYETLSNNIKGGLIKQKEIPFYA